ncbi:MAG: hormogonium polysaccharide biosynthesis protein HpsA, partial [Scytonema sp. PMC 1069.18]|nr:hormogonium polysaccharide biosynthesis protein HpsA [Scytonema sp. PMC 1069.18]
DLEDQEAITTAWKFPVDTDNNGLYDTYTLYGVFFRSPSRGTDGKFDRARNPLEARTPPMDDGSLGGICSAAKGTSSSLVGESGWYKAGASIKKSFFVYVVNVPNYTVDSTKKLEKYKGNKGFSAIEFQEDQERVPVVSNAVVYEDDLEITPGRGLRINGSMFTNSNLLTARTNDGSGREIRFYQVSSPKSCFYQAQNSKILIGGNVGNGRITGEGEGKVTEVDLFKPGDQGTTTKIDGTNKSASNKAGEIAYNTKAFAERIDAQVEAVRGTDTTKFKDYSNDPKEVRDNIKARIGDNPGLDVAEVRREELESYFKKRTRRVPFTEVLLTADAPAAPTLQGKSIKDSESGEDTLRGPDAWIYPTDTNTKLTLRLNQLSATEPNKLKEIYKDEEKLLGDRVLVGNNLPALWFNKDISAFVGRGFPQQVDNDKTEWDDWEDIKYKYRTRSTQVQELISLGGLTNRDGYFEDKATQKPKNPLDNVGGMRVITGAGIYVDGPSSDTNASYPWDGTTTQSFLADSRPSWDTNFVDPTNTDTSNNKVQVNSLKFNDKGTLKDPIIVYPDSMPMTGGSGALTQKGDLLMRATAVYHYANNSGNNQTPIACVSSYYDPTNAITAQNESKFTSKWKNPDADASTNAGKSNNGIVYPPPYTSAAARTSAITTYSKQLRQQARLVFPNGRFVNEPLRKALKKVDDNETLSMADNSAIDTTICAIRIIPSDPSFVPSSSPLLPHGAIYETAFLDARQIKSVEKQSNVSSLTGEPYYERSLEERQPLEVRVTVLDLDQLRKKTIGTDEYLLPNSGIIYATRDDALADLSSQPGGNIDTTKLLSPTDYKLDPTRRPNGIMLINGKEIYRRKPYEEKEKGLILATNLPAYVKGNFNLHRKVDTTTSVEEFSEQLRDDEGNIDWSKFYTRVTLDENFACRKGDPRLPKCTTGDSWRPATVLSDAVTILSDNFRFGFRDEGDYDLRNNEGDFRASEYRKHGFFDTNFLTSSNWFDTDGFPKDFDTKTGTQGSSYVNNFVTPIQRRVKFNEYLMEVCTNLPISSCKASDWSVDGVGLKATDEIGKIYSSATHKAGTTVDLATSDLTRYARRVAFARKSSDGSLELDDKGQPVPLGIDNAGKIQAFPRNTVTGKSWSVGVPQPKAGALWFRTTTKIDALPTSSASDTNYGYQYHL